VLAYDHHGDPGIMFYDEDKALRYARRVLSFRWNFQSIDQGDVGDDFGQ
jgi:hypothetical protein